MSARKKASSNTRKSGVSTRQTSRIKELSSQGRSTNEIQRTLSREGIGLRRSVMLEYVREYRGKAPPTNPSKNIPTKYRGTTAQRKWKKRQRDWRRGRVREKKPEEGWGNKKVVLQGRIDGKRVLDTRRGSGKELYDFIKAEMDSGDWDTRPSIVSE
jgi:hypothetical protein